MYVLLFITKEDQIMAGHVSVEQRIEVICQFKTNALIIPIKIRVVDEDGEFQDYVIKAYKECPLGEDLILPNGVHVRRHLRTFECKIVTFGSIKNIKIYFDAQECLWKLSP